MNCQEFDQIVNDLAKPKPVEVTLHEKGLAHAAACQDCSVRLANVRALADGMKTLAATTNNSEASTQTEALLLAAFRQQSFPASSARQSNFVASPAKKSWPKLLPTWAYAAAAAMIVAVAGFAASMWLKTPPPQEVAIAPSPSPSIEVKRQDAVRSELASLPSNQSINLRPKGRKLQKFVDDGSSVQSSLGELTLLAGEEIATDFLSLTHETDSQPMESGQVIRVQMQRTALASFGLPVNIERANETIKADLLLAEDGSARAIRFIR
ncbi:MAG: hypothetical protein AAB401_20810 [Acidobacteriota bacterium]